MVWHILKTKQIGKKTHGFCFFFSDFSCAVGKKLGCITLLKCLLEISSYRPREENDPQKWRFGGLSLRLHIYFESCGFVWRWIVSPAKALLPDEEHPDVPHQPDLPTTFPPKSVTNLRIPRFL